MENMADNPQATAPPKPRSHKVRPHLTRLPDLTPKRMRVRQRLQRFAQFLVRNLTRTEVFGLENFPQTGPALIVLNHLGDADAAIGLAHLPVAVDAMGKVELYDLPILGKILDAYGVVWVHRGRPDRRALRAVLNGLDEGRFIAIAPEGRQSVTGGLEAGTGGAAYLALKADVPIIPITFTGAEDANIYGSWLRLRRGQASMTVGPAFKLDPYTDRREAIRLGTEKIMQKLASQLPEAYQGVFRDILEKEGDSVSTK